MSDKSQFFTTLEETRQWLDQTGVTNYSVTEKLIVNVEGSVCLNYERLKYLPVQFGVVSENFECEGNILRNLQGAPRKVGGFFSCAKNKLTSLVGAPEEVGKDYFCMENRLLTLTGCPPVIHGHFNCSQNDLISLLGGPEQVEKMYMCDNNELISLQGAPEHIKRDFKCAGNQLDSLQYAPKSIEGDLCAANNPLKELSFFDFEVSGKIQLSLPESIKGLDTYLDEDRDVDMNFNEFKQLWHTLLMHDDLMNQLPATPELRRKVKI